MSAPTVYRCTCGREVELPYRKTARVKYRLNELALGEALWLPIHPYALNSSVDYWQKKTGKMFNRHKTARDGVHGVLVTRVA